MSLVLLTLPFIKCSLHFLATARFFYLAFGTENSRWRLAEQVETRTGLHIMSKA